jgi:hypothetical protein
MVKGDGLTVIPKQLRTVYIPGSLSNRVSSSIFQTSYTR